MAPSPSTPSPKCTLLTQSLISKSQCPHQSHTFPALTQATHTLLLPTVSVHADVVYLLSALKGVRNLSWAPERRVGREVRGLVMGLRLERLWTRLSTFMDDPYDISDSEDGSTSVLPPGMLDNVTHLTLVDPIEDWAKWDWKAILASRKGGIEGLKWISVCAAKSHVRLEREMMWKYMEPPSADKEFFVNGLNVKNRGSGGDAKSKSREEDTNRSSNGNGIVCICCVKINEDEHASHPPYKVAHIVDKTVHYSRAELWMRMLGIDINGLEKCSADRDQIRMDIAPGFMWEEHRMRFGVLYGRLLERQ